MGSHCRHAHGIHELRPRDGQSCIDWFPIPYYSEQDPYFHTFHMGFLETPTPTTVFSEMASCADADDASDPGTTMTEASAPAQPDGAPEDGHHVPASTQPEPRQLPGEQQASLRPSIFARRWKDEEDDDVPACTPPEPRQLPREQRSSLRPSIFARRWKDEEETEEENDQDEEALGKFLNSVRKLSKLKNVTA